MEIGLHTQLAFPIGDASQVGGVRREAVELAKCVGLDETATGHVALIATEMATNIVKHARPGGGELLVRAFGSPDGIELLAVDRGPGMDDVAKCFRDGYSTAGSPGTGLGAIRRLASAFDIFTMPGQGTALLARIVPSPRKNAILISDAPATKTANEGDDRLHLGIVSVPMRGEAVCGDGWDVCTRNGRTIVMVADGIGHGPLAAQAVSEVGRVIREAAVTDPTLLMERAHGALRSTRGAAVAIAELRWGERMIVFTGVGNILASVVSPGHVRGMASNNGTVGHQVSRMQGFSYPWPKGATLILHSDGISARWKMDSYPGLLMRDPSLVAGVLYRDFTRHRDDATLLALRERLPS